MTRIRSGSSSLTIFSRP